MPSHDYHGKVDNENTNHEFFLKFAPNFTCLPAPVSNTNLKI
jgi:hypothetical protein